MRGGSFPDMGLKRFVAGRSLRALKTTGGQDPRVLEEAKSRLVAAGSSVIPDLLELLADPAARGPAREILETLLTDATLPVYADALSSGRPGVAAAVGEILKHARRYDPAGLIELLSLPSPAREGIVSVLEARASDVGPSVLVRRLADGPREARAPLLHLLEESRHPSTHLEILPLLDNRDWSLRIQGLKLAGRHRSDPGLVAAERLLSDPHKLVRLQAAQTLRRLEAHGSIPALCRALRDPDLKVHTAAIDALIHFADVSAVAYLVDVLKDPSEYARRGAVEVLNEVATTDAIADLLRALGDVDWWVRVRAADALGSLGGDRVVDAVLGLMDSEDLFLRRYAVEILNSAPASRAVETLIRALDDPDWWVCERAVDALGKTRDPRAVGPLTDLMMRNPTIAPLCIQALCAIDDESALESLARAVGSAHGEIRRESIEALRAASVRPIRKDLREKIEALLKEAGVPMSRPAGEPLGVRPKPVFSDPETGRSRPSHPRLPEPEAQGPAPSIPQAQGPRAAPEQPPQRAFIASQIPPGTLLAERYRVVRKIGDGGFGFVYLVLDTSVGEELILKILSPHISADESMIRRFVQELKYTRRIAHRNVIRLYDFLDLDGAHAISMEYFPGRSLAAVLVDGPLEFCRGFHILEQVCDGLQAAHVEGIIHRDVKPANTLVGDDDAVKLVDFGLASMAQHASSRLTKSGILMGTPHYMAPEQITGGDLDVRTDIYSLGVMMFEMFAGRPPYDGDAAVHIIYQHLQGETPSLKAAVPGVPDLLDAVVARAMAKAPKDRPSSVEELRSLLRDIAA